MPRGVVRMRHLTLMRSNAAEAAALVDLAHELEADGVVFSQLRDFPHIRRWQVSRENWRFDYAAERLADEPQALRAPLQRALARARHHGVRLQLTSGLHEVLPEAALS